MCRKRVHFIRGHKNVYLLLPKHSFASFLYFLLFEPFLGTDSLVGLKRAKLSRDGREADSWTRPRAHMCAEEREEGTGLTGHNGGALLEEFLWKNRTS